MTFSGLLDALSGLKDGWDSYGGKAPTQEAIATARKLLEYISVSPLRDGGLQIELGGADVDAIVVIAPNGIVEP